MAGIVGVVTDTDELDGAAVLTLAQTAGDADSRTRVVVGVDAGNSDSHTFTSNPRSRSFAMNSSVSVQACPAGRWKVSESVRAATSTQAPSRNRRRSSMPSS